LIKADKLLKEISAFDKKVIVLGDGVHLLRKSMENISQVVENIIPAHPVFSMPRASSIAASALHEYNRGNTKDCFSIKPFYIRKSNAEEKWEERYGAKS